MCCIPPHNTNIMASYSNPIQKYVYPYSNAAPTFIISQYFSMRVSVRDLVHTLKLKKGSFLFFNQVNAHFSSSAFYLSTFKCFFPPLVWASFLRCGESRKFNFGIGWSHTRRFSIIYFLLLDSLVLFPYIHALFSSGRTFCQRLITERELSLHEFHVISSFSEKVPISFCFGDVFFCCWWSELHECWYSPQNVCAHRLTNVNHFAMNRSIDT